MDKETKDIIKLIAGIQIEISQLNQGGCQKGQ